MRSNPESLNPNILKPIETLKLKLANPDSASQPYASSPNTTQVTPGRLMTLLDQ